MLTTAETARSSRLGRLPAVVVSECMRHNRRQSGQFKRLTQHVISTHAFCLLTDFIIQFCAHQDAGQAGGTLVQVSYDIQTRDMRHVNVNHGNMDSRVFNQIQRFPPVAGFDYMETPSLQSFANNLAKSVVVIRHKQVRYVHRGVIISTRLICCRDCIETAGKFNSMMITTIAALFTTTT